MKITLKDGRDVYKRQPQSDNAGRLAELRQLITNEERIRRVFDQLYEEESILPKIRNL